MVKAFNTVFASVLQNGGKVAGQPATVFVASDDAEVRALASRYGNPDEILKRDWIPELPGITVPGDYNEDYASDPGTYWTDWARSIFDGTNTYIGD